MNELAALSLGKYNPNMTKIINSDEKFLKVATKVSVRSKEVLVC